MRYRDHGKLWRMVEGAVVDALTTHADYLTAKGRRSAVQSITKRVVGQLVGHAKQAQERGQARVCRGGSGGGAASSVPSMGAGRQFFPLSRTRLPALHDLLTGGDA
jgi:hypothetical protein